MHFMNMIDFTFSDTIAGSVTTTDWNTNTFGLKTPNGREYIVKLTDSTDKRIISNSKETAPPLSNSRPDIITSDKYLFAYGIFYPEAGGYTFEAKNIIFVGQEAHDYNFEAPSWWVEQIRGLAEFYFNAQFPDGTIDYRNY